MQEITRESFYYDWYSKCRNYQILSVYIVSQFEGEFKIGNSTLSCEQQTSMCLEIAQPRISFEPPEANCQTQRTFGYDFGNNLKHWLFKTSEVHRKYDDYLDKRNSSIYLQLKILCLFSYNHGQVSSLIQKTLNMPGTFQVIKMFSKQTCVQSYISRKHTHTHIKWMKYIFCIFLMLFIQLTCLSKIKFF